MTSLELDTILSSISREVSSDGWSPDEIVSIGVGATVSTVMFIVWLRDNNQLNYEYANREIKAALENMRAQYGGSEQATNQVLRNLGIEQAAKN